MGRRWGKTYMAGSYGLCMADAGAWVAWVVPTYKNARPVWRFAEALVARHPRVQVRKADMVIQFPSGGWLGVYTADNDVAIRGENFDDVIVEEAGQIREVTWTDVILPTLADRDGRALLISTPKGRNWFYHEWMRGKGGQEGYHSWQAPTLDNPNPNIQKAARMAKDRVSERTFKQEWLAQFLEDGGEVFRRVRELATVLQLLGGIPGRQAYVIGADWGKHNDWSVFTVLDSITAEVVHIDRMQQVDYVTQKDRLKSLRDRFNGAAIIAETNAMGEPVIDMLRRDGVPVAEFTTGNANKTAIIEDLALAFERGFIKIPNFEPLILELESFEMSKTPSGLLKYAAPEGLHDDCVMSLALAWHMASNPTQQVRFRWL